MSRQNFFEIERLIFSRKMAHRRNRALHNKNIRARFLRDGAEFDRALRNRADGRDRASVFDLADARRDQILLHRFLVNFLQQRGHFRFVGLDNFLQNFLRIFVARLHAFEIQNGKAAELAHRDGETHIDDAIHGAGQDWDLQFQRLRIFARQTPRVSTSLGLIVTRPGTSAISSNP